MSSTSHWTSTPPPHYDAPRSSPYQHTTLTPYLQLSHLLSLTWLAYPILSLLFVAFRLQLSSASAQDSVESARNDLLSACSAAEHAATVAASLPRYLASATNTRIAAAVNDTMSGAREALVLALTVMEAIINFIVDTYRSTFLCFLELAVRGALSILIGAVQEFNTFLTSTLGSIRTSIQNDISSANNVIQSAVSAINKINPFGNISVPQFSIPSLSALQNVTLPSDIQNALLQLNASLPTISDLKQAVDQIIDTPFELLKQDINNTFIGLSFDESVLPVPAQNTITFCDQLDTSGVDGLAHDLVVVTRIATLLLVAAALLLLGWHCFVEWYKWRCLKRHLRRMREAWTSDPTLTYGGTKKMPTIEMTDHNLMMLQGISHHPLLTKIANKFQSLLRLSPSQHIHLQWFFHYVFHPPALACFLIGFFGLLSVELQLVAIRPLEYKFDQIVVASVNDFSTLINSKINEMMFNQSADYANFINTRTTAIQNTVNNGVFSWVNGTTSILNDTINEFYTDIQNAVTVVFNNTVFEEPIQEFLRCFLGSKVDAVETALTFLQDNLNINIPQINDSVLVLSPDRINEVTQPIATAAVGGTNSDGTTSQGLVGKLVAAYIAVLKKERYMFGIFLGLWAIVVATALIIIFWHSYGRDWINSYKKRKWHKEQRSGIDGIVVPFRDRAPRFGTSGGSEFTEGEAGDMEKKAHHVDLPSFTPMPSPKPGLFNSYRTPSFYQNNNPNDAYLHPPTYPYRNQNPEFQKSWDTLMDQANPMASAESRRTFKFSAPKRFLSFKKSRSTSASTAASKGEDGDEKSRGVHGVSWLNKFTGAFWKKQEEQEESMSEKGRPRLTITVEKTPDFPPIERDSVFTGAEPAEPTSHWSVSPGPPSKLTWVKDFVPPKRPSLSLSFVPKSRRTASVPDSVHSVRDSFAVNSQPEPQFAMPLHHGFERSTPPVSYPKQQHRSQLAFASNVYTPPTPSIPTPSILPPPGITTPRSQFLHTRHASLAGAGLGVEDMVDPFATPFDDEYRVMPTSGNDLPPLTPYSTTKSTTSSNPFVTVAI